jgi:hypothetical protein
VQTLVTHNDKDFQSLHEAWVTWRRRWTLEIEESIGQRLHLSQHAGVLIVPHGYVHDLAQIIEEFVDSAGAMEDRLFTWDRARGWHELHF